MVPAHKTNDTPPEGRLRSDESSWPTPENVKIVHDSAQGVIAISTENITAKIDLKHLAFTWSNENGVVFAQDRKKHAYCFGSDGSFRHALFRDQGDVYHGLGDKTGKLNLHGSLVSMDCSNWLIQTILLRT